LRVGILLSGTRRNVGAERLKNQYGDADRDRAVRDVERRPVPGTDIDVDEIDDFAVHYAIVEIAERAADHCRVAVRSATA